MSAMTTGGGLMVDLANQFSWQIRLAVAMSGCLAALSRLRPVAVRILEHRDTTPGAKFSSDIRAVFVVGRLL
jgi:hypothetical protein